jgi:hypothetical protein
MSPGGPGQATSSGTPEPRGHELGDLYELLEISPRASQGVIHAAYRVLARNYHPDVNASTEAARRIRQLNAAYEVLSDPAGRAHYDFECARAHRFERVNMVDSSTASSASRPRGRAELAVRRTGVRLPVDDRFPTRGGQVVLGLLIVTALSAILMAFVWATLEAAEAPLTYMPPPLEFSQR